MKNRFFWFSGLVVAIGGILLVNLGPNYGIPSLVGDICIFAGLLIMAALGAGIPRDERPFLGIWLGLGIIGVFLHDLGKPHVVLIQAGDGCLIASMLTVVFWAIVHWKRAKKTRQNEIRQPSPEG